MNIQRKIVLWCVPRSCSTAFSKAIAKNENVKVVMEPFAYPFYYGEERVNKRFQDFPPLPNMKFKDIKKSLESDFNDCSNVFVKDMGHFLNDHLDRLNEVLPEGYQHTFLIRHPRQTVLSYCKILLQDSTTRYSNFNAADIELKSLHALFFKIKEQTGETPVLVDAADLLETPNRMLNKYCMMTGLPFSEDMLEWDQGGMIDLEKRVPGFQQTLNQTTGFIKPAPPTPKEETQLSEEAKQSIEDNMVYYNTLYKYRITC